MPKNKDIRKEFSMRPNAQSSRTVDPKMDALSITSLEVQFGNSGLIVIHCDKRINGQRKPAYSTMLKDPSQAASLIGRILDGEDPSSWESDGPLREAMTDDDVAFGTDAMRVFSGYDLMSARENWPQIGEFFAALNKK
jgi:hypothetical protein